MRYSSRYRRRRRREGRARFGGLFLVEEFSSQVGLVTGTVLGVAKRLAVRAPRVCDGGDGGVRRRDFLGKVENGNVFVGVEQRFEHRGESALDGAKYGDERTRGIFESPEHGVLHSALHGTSVEENGGVFSRSGER